MIDALGQLDLLKDTPQYVPVIMVVLAFGGFAWGYRWMRATTKAEIAEEVARLQSQINDLVREVRDLRNGRAKAQRLIMFSLEELPQVEQNEKGRKLLHDAIDALTNVPQSEA